MFRFKPIAQSSIMNLWLAIPKPIRQSALDLQVIQLEFDFLDAL